MVSLSFTVISIIVAVISLFVQKQILFDQDLIMIEFDVIGPAVVNKESKCKSLVHSLTSRMSAILGVDKALLEILRPTNIPNGLKVHMNIHVVDDDEDKNLCEEFEDEMDNSLKNGQVQSVFKNCWQLDDVPHVLNLYVTTKDSKKKIRKMNTMEGMQMTSTSPGSMEQKEEDEDVDQILLGTEEEGANNIQPGSMNETHMPQDNEEKEQKIDVDEDVLDEVNTIENGQEIDDEVLKEANTVGDDQKIDDGDVLDEVNTIQHEEVVGIDGDVLNEINMIENEETIS